MSRIASHDAFAIRAEAEVASLRPFNALLRCPRLYNGLIKFPNVPSQNSVIIPSRSKDLRGPARREAKTSDCTGSMHRSHDSIGSPARAR
mmetsp:Transcript_15448/g.49284  ORF Transcript_15448/g.49284 Transcript_15448/m.49284 type:complete len:90 (-) Transcript_15448:1243-1512(-)